MQLPERLVLVRHAMPETGDRDPGLSAHGRVQADAISTVFAAVGIVPDRIFCSPRRRTTETAELLASALDSQLSVDRLSSACEGHGATCLVEIARSHGTIVVVTHEDVIQDVVAAVAPAEPFTGYGRASTVVIEQGVVRRLPAPSV